MEVLWIPLAAISVPIIVVPTALAFKHARRVRELEHLERMRSIELGRAQPGDEPWSIPARIILAIGAGVPIGVMLVAFMSSRFLGYHEGIWIASGIVSTMGVIAGSSLAGQHFSAQARGASAVEKPQFDPDSLDVVSRRG
jgi:hypothetical protein